MLARTDAPDVISAYIPRRFFSRSSLFGCLFTGELAGGDRVARLSEGDDFAFEVPGREPFRHVFRQGTAEGAHALEPDRPAGGSGK